MKKPAISRRRLAVLLGAAVPASAQTAPAPKPSGEASEPAVLAAKNTAALAMAVKNSQAEPAFRFVP